MSISTRIIQYGELGIVIEALTPTSEEVVSHLDESFQHFQLKDDYAALARVVFGLGLEQSAFFGVLNGMTDHARYVTTWVHSSVRVTSVPVALHKLLSCVDAAAAEYYAPRGGILLHAAAASLRHQGFLFLGKSGAGKSTTAKNTAKVGIPVLGEDRVFVLPSKNGEYVLGKAQTYPAQLITHPELIPPLRGIFLLAQDTNDHLERMTQTQTAKMMFQAFQEHPAGSALPPKLLRSIFQTACQIARQVPGYILHLRNAPDFWNLIDAEFPN